MFVNPPAIQLWQPLWLLPDIQNWVLLAEQRCFLWFNPAPVVTVTTTVRLT